MRRVALHLGDCLAFMAGMPAESVDAIVTDPPYGLEFMGREWDSFNPGAPLASSERGEHMVAGTDWNGRARERMVSPAKKHPKNERCTVCGLWRVSSNRCKCPEPSFEYRSRREAPPQMLAFEAFAQSFAEEAWRVAKPGAHLAAFGGTRTYHRLVCAVEDAGWEIRDCLSWLYGSGFPKSMDVARAIDKAARGVPQGGPDPTSPAHGQYRGGCSPESPGGRGFGAGPGAFVATSTECSFWARGEECRGHGDAGQSQSGPTVHRRRLAPTAPEALPWTGWGTALKPAWEPILLARKPFSGTVAANVLLRGTGALNIDGCRIGYTSDADKAGATPQGRVTSKPSAAIAAAPDAGRDLGRVEFGRPEQNGRWPANVLMDEEAGRILDAQTEVSRSSSWTAGERSGSVSTDFLSRGRAPQVDRGYDDEGGRSRFFYCPKASRAEREEGLDDLEPVVRTDGREALDGPGADNPRLRSSPRRNNHPTVKPVDLMRWLVRLVAPPDGLVLDPFLGSGTTGVAAVLEDRAFVGADLDPRYVDIARGRVLAAMRRARTPLFDPGIPQLFP